MTIVQKLAFRLGTGHRYGVLVNNLHYIWAEVLVIEKRKPPVMQCAEAGAWIGRELGFGILH